MENAQKALIMAGSVFMFVIAITTAIFSYSRVIEIIDTILSTSEQNDRASEYFMENNLENNLNFSRVATKSEVIMAILSMQDDDFVANEVRVNGMSFFKSEGERLDEKLNRIVENEKNNYEVTFNLNNLQKPIIIFK